MHRSSSSLISFHLSISILRLLNSSHHLFSLSHFSSLQLSVSSTLISPFPYFSYLRLLNSSHQLSISPFLIFPCFHLLTSYILISSSPHLPSPYTSPHLSSSLFFISSLRFSFSHLIYTTHLLISLFLSPYLFLIIHQLTSHLLMANFHLSYPLLISSTRHVI